MKPEIDVKEGSPPPGEWTRAPGVRGRTNGVESAVLLRRNKEKRSDAQPRATIRVTQRYGVSPSRAFDAWLDPEVAGRWLFATASQPIADVQIDGRIGGSFCFVDRQVGETTQYTGRYVEIVPARRLVFTLSMEPHPNVITRVTVAIAPLAKGCVLKLTHENMPRSDANYVEGRWTGILYGLGVTLDSASATFHHDQE
jgi:uncharacterized protein YndB with AHSA1/START domain